MRVIRPPRPRGKIVPALLVQYEREGGWSVQRKFNGQRSVFYVPHDRHTVLMWNRHGELHGNFVPPKELIRDFLNLDLDPALDYWFDGEILDNKTKTPEYKNKAILFDVLQAGRYFFGSPSLRDRVTLLDKICRHPTVLEPHRGIALTVTPNLWMAETFTSDFVRHFNEMLTLDEIEGVMLKQLASVLQNTGQKEYEVDWMIRCRKPSKNYNH